MPVFAPKSTHLLTLSPGNADSRVAKETGSISWPPLYKADNKIKGVNYAKG
jgi:hypothetical protein